MSERTDIERDLLRVLDHPGFVEVSHHPELERPWAVGIDLTIWQDKGDRRAITWFYALNVTAALTLAVIGIEEAKS